MFPLNKKCLQKANLCDNTRYPSNNKPANFFACFKSLAVKSKSSRIHHGHSNYFQ